MNFTYDVPKPNGGLKQQETNGDIVLEHIDQNTSSSYKFYLKKEPISNLKNQNVYYRYRLIAIKFVVQQTTPTLSPTFGVVSNTVDQQGNTVNVVQPNTNTNTTTTTAIIPTIQQHQ